MKLLATDYSRDKLDSVLEVTKVFNAVQCATGQYWMGSINFMKLCTVHTLSSALLINMATTNQSSENSLEKNWKCRDSIPGLLGLR